MQTTKIEQWTLRASAAVLAAALFANSLTAAEPGEQPYEQLKNIVYAETDGVGLVMDVFVPTGPGNGLGIVDVASGAWHSDRGKIRDHKRAQMFDIMCGRGFTVFAVRPGSQSKFTIPEMHRHVHQAIRWIKAHREEYGIDPDRLALVGASAGGHLASLAAVTGGDGDANSDDQLAQQSTRVAAVVAFFPPTDFANWAGRELDLEPDGRWVRGFGRMLFGDTLAGKSSDEIAEAVRSISPAKLVTSQAPPFLLVHGDADLVVPMQQSEVFRDALETAGVAVELIVKPGGGHPWPTINEEIAVAADWLERQLTGGQAVKAAAAGAGQ